jgi:hypothetical protein
MSVELPAGAPRATPRLRPAREAMKRALPAAVAGTRRHWLFAFLLVAGAAFRGITLFAYRPALIYFDSTRYFENVADLHPRPVRPMGYPAFLRFLLGVVDDVAVVPFVQHAMGLLIAILIYALLLRLGVRRWLAALASAPVLLDAYQLNIEQYVLSETLFDLLLVAGCVLLLWRRPLGVPSAGLAGALFAAAALTRGTGLLVIGPAILAVLFLRARLWCAVALVAAFALPIAGYAAWFHSLHGVYALTGYEGRFLYARVAPFAECSKLSVPRRERVLCPQGAVGHRPTVEEFMWSNTLSPVYRVKPPPGSDSPRWVYRSKLAGDFAKRVVLHQPLTYARIVATDFVRSFAPTKTTRAGELPVSRWQFQRSYPLFRPQRTREILRAHGGRHAYVEPELASFLRTYQRFGYTPGPLLAVGLLAAVTAALGAGRARRSGLRTAAFLFSSVSVVVFLGAIAVNQFTWRYQLSELVLLPPAAALGIAALTNRRSGASGSPPENSGSADGDVKSAASASQAGAAASAKPA